MSASPKVIGLEEGWSGIKEKAIDALEDILNTGVDKTTKTFSPNTFMPIYTTCYNMCTQRQPYNWSEQLYQRHGDTIKAYLQSTVLPALRDKHDEYLLKELNHRWLNHKIMNKWMTRFFMYLDRYYVKHHSLPTLAEAGLKLFKTLIFDVVKKDAVNAMLALINRERDGEIVDRGLLKCCVEVFEAMGLGSLDAYNQDFEDFLLTNSEEYYARKSQEWIQTDSTPAYMKKAEDSLGLESQRVLNYLNTSTESKLLRVCEKELLEKHERELLDKEGSGCRFLLENDKSEDLSRMYRVFSRVDEGLPPVAAIVKQHIEQMGNEVVNRREAQIASDPKKESASDPALIKELLELHDKYKGVVNGQFAGNALFQKALKEAFVEFINRSVGKFTSADYMSTFCDRILKGQQKLSEQQVEEFLEKVVQIFSYLTDKDLFAEIYRNQLSKRLLNQRSASDDAERAMIGKLKLQCGAQFTGKMEGMLNDLAIGADHKADFEKHLTATAETISLDKFEVQVLTTGYWPTYKALEVNLPPAMVKCTAVFKDYYDHKTSHRRLQWVHGLGGAEVTARYKKKKYDLSVTTLQSIMLLEFNAEKEFVTFPEMVEALNLSEETVKRLMHSVSCGKHKLIEKIPKGRTIGLDDKFAFNEKFTCPMRKIRVAMASLEESHNPKRVEEDRSIAIEAAVVRIMKARKTLPHQQLLAEVLSQLAFFRPNPKVIKRRIEALIDREYLERDPEKASTYRYLA